MASFHLGIDLHKKFAYWSLINDKRKILWQGEVETNPKTVVSALKELPVPTNQIQAAVEPVEQWGWYADLLEENGATVSLSDPLKTKLIASSRLKHDKVDSLILAELLRTDFLPTAYLSPQPVRELKEFLRWRIFFVRIRTRIKNRIHSILAKHGLSSPYTDLFGKRGMIWLKKQELRPVFASELESLLNTMNSLNAEIKALNKEVRKRARQDEELIILQSIPGIGPFNALMIKAEVGDFKRFPSPAKLSAYAGLVSSSYSSGEKQRFGRITKQGSRYLRWVMVEAAQKAKPNWGKLYSFYQRIKQKKGNRIARVALARKLLCLSWTLIKKKEPFRVLPNRGFSSVKQ